jgi:hypothetical protein
VSFFRPTHCSKAASSKVVASYGDLQGLDVIGKGKLLQVLVASRLGPVSAVNASHQDIVPFDFYVLLYDGQKLGILRSGHENDFRR